MQYPHRRNPDGFLDSICPRCYVTVARANHEPDLQRAESAHICDAWRLGYYKNPDSPLTFAPRGIVTGQKLASCWPLGTPNNPASRLI